MQSKKTNNLGYSYQPFTFECLYCDGEINNPLIWNNPLLSNKYNGDLTNQERILNQYGNHLRNMDGLV